MKHIPCEPFVITLLLACSCVLDKMAAQCCAWLLAAYKLNVDLQISKFKFFWAKWLAWLNAREMRKPWNPAQGSFTFIFLSTQEQAVEGDLYYPSVCVFVCVCVRICDKWHLWRLLRNAPGKQNHHLKSAKEKSISLAGIIPFILLSFIYLTFFSG